MAAGRRELDRVREQIEHDLIQPLFVGTHDHVGVAGKEIEGDAFTGRLRSNEREERLEHVTDNHIADVEAEPACFKITKSDEIVDETTNVALCFLNALHVHTLRVVEGAANTKGEQVRVAAHRGERRAEHLIVVDAKQRHRRLVRVPDDTLAIRHDVGDRRFLEERSVPGLLGFEQRAARGELLGLDVELLFGDRGANVAKFVQSAKPARLRVAALSPRRMYSGVYHAHL